MTDKTGAERQRRYMARLRSVTDAKLREEIAELKRQLAEAQAHKQPPVTDATVTDAKLREEIRQLRQQCGQLRRGNAELRQQCDKLHRQLRYLKVTPESEEMAKLERQLKAAQTRIMNLTVEAKGNPATLSKAQLRTMARPPRANIKK